MARPRFSTSEHRSTSGIRCASFHGRLVAAGKAAQEERPRLVLTCLCRVVYKGFDVTVAQFCMVAEWFLAHHAEQYSFVLVLCLCRNSFRTFSLFERMKLSSRWWADLIQISSGRR